MDSWAFNVMRLDPEEQPFRQQPLAEVPMVVQDR